MKEFYNIDVSGTVPIVSIRGIIGGCWFDEGVTEQEFIRDVEALGDVKNIEVHISSKGGSVSVGLGIYNYLVKHPANIKTVVFSEASSIASVIALAGNDRIMLEGTTMFIHEPLTGVMGYAADLFKTGDYLVTIKNAILDIYERVTGQSRSALAELMRNETLMNAHEALRRGFATSVETPKTPVLNLGDDELFKERMLMEAELVVKNKRISALEAKLSETNAGNEPMKIVNVIESDEFVNWIASEEGERILMKHMFVKKEKVDEQKKAEITAEIKAICAAAKRPEAAEHFIAAGTPVEQVRETLFSALTSGQHEINGTTPITLVTNKTEQSVSGWKQAHAKARALSHLN